MILPRWAPAVLCRLAAQPAGATTPAAFYIGHSLLWRDRATGQAGELWLNVDGRYVVFYDSLRTAEVHLFRWEARQGAYQATVAPGGVKLCLQPDGDVVPRGSGVGVPLFHDAGCIIIPVHPIGEVSAFDQAGRSDSMALAQGR
jgi:hypothetical protein